ncbi:flagellar biosynthesis regulator FlaF [Tropicimonas marinistellae]|uniref:flagellar biosynthesis regulator FlaF n=1 Tax=Tropicimonas marinistellae TaxID=1739787 RepID=UPI0008364C39|nr:flagellar biosynthesis regulator FlaF [Tropicimonas marinistellae]
MNVVDLAQRAYGATAAPVRTSRSTEYAVFAKVTKLLVEGVKSGRSDFAKLARSLYENRRLWLALAVDVAQDGNALPTPMRAQIFYLSEFVDQHSRKVLKGEASAQTLIEINAAMMRGLAQEGAPV